MVEKIQVNRQSIYNAVINYVGSDEFSQVVDKIVEKNTQYDDSWQQIGSILSLIHI